MKLTEDRAVKVIRKDKVSAAGNSYTQYSLMVSSKQDDEWVNGFLDCAFKKGVSVNNKAKIKINNAFPVLNKYNDKVYIKWMITEFEIVEEGEAPATTDSSFVDVPDDIGDLPFK